MAPPPTPPSPTPPSGWKGFVGRVRRRYTDRQLGGAGLTVLALLVTLGLAIWGSSDTPPTLVVALLLTVLAGLFQTGAAWLFSHGQGTAESTHAASSIVNLMRAFGRARDLRQGVEQAVTQQGTTALQLRQQLGLVSVQLEFIEERTEDAIYHWNQFYPDAVRAARESREGEPDD